MVLVLVNLIVLAINYYLIVTVAGVIVFAFGLLDFDIRIVRAMLAAVCCTLRILAVFLSVQISTKFPFLVLAIPFLRKVTNRKITHSTSGDNSKPCKIATEAQPSFMLSVSLGLIPRMLLTSMSMTFHVVVDVSVGVGDCVRFVPVVAVDSVANIVVDIVVDAEGVCEVEIDEEGMLTSVVVVVVVGLNVTAAGSIASGIYLFTQYPARCK